MLTNGDDGWNLELDMYPDSIALCISGTCGGRSVEVL